LACSNGDPTSRPRHAGPAVASSAPLRPQAEAIASNEPPTVSVAEVSTVVDRVNTWLRSKAATVSGATRNTGRGEPRLSSWSSHTTSVRSGIAGPNDVRIRDVVSEISLSAATASARAAAAFESLVVSMSARAAPATSRSARR
jgi:hypothetical protein